MAKKRKSKPKKKSNKFLALFLSQLVTVCLLFVLILLSLYFYFYTSFEPLHYSFYSDGRVVPDFDNDPRQAACSHFFCDNKYYNEKQQILYRYCKCFKPNIATYVAAPVLVVFQDDFDTFIPWPHRVWLIHGTYLYFISLSITSLYFYSKRRGII